MKEHMHVIVSIDTITNSLLKDLESNDTAINNNRISKNHILAISNANPPSEITISLTENITDADEPCYTICMINTGDTEHKTPLYQSCNPSYESLKSVIEKMIRNIRYGNDNDMTDSNCHICIHGYNAKAHDYHDLCGADRCYRCQQQFGGKCSDFKEGNIPAEKYHI